MARSGILGQSKPTAATDTLLYSAPIDKSASTVLTVANDGTGSNFSVAVKDFSQEFTVDGSSYLLHEGDVLTNHRFELSANISDTGFIAPGDTITSTDGEKTAKFHGFYVPPQTDIFVKDVVLKRITVENVTGTFAAGETLDNGSGVTALIYEYSQDFSGSYITIGPETGGTFAAGDSVGNGGTATGTISTGGVGTAGNEFVFSTTTAGGVYSSHFDTTPPSLLTDRTYRFDVSDSSMTGRDFKLSVEVNGEWGPDGVFSTADDGTEFTTGKTTNGTAGSAGAYVQYDFSQGTNLDGSIYFYDGGTGTASNADYGGDDRLFNFATSFFYTEIYVYDLTGSWVTSTDTFTIGSVEYTLDGQTSGKWGYVKDYSSTTLKIILGETSSAFIATDTFYDSPLSSTANRSLVTISSVDVDVAAVSASNYIVEGATNSANDVYRITSLVVGPGQSVVVNSTTANNTFSLIGFEDNSTEITVRNFNNLSS